MDFLESAKNFIQRLSSAPLGEWLHILPMLRLKSLQKGEFFFKQGEPFGEVGYVAKGLLHTFFTDTEGYQATKNFAWEGRLIAPYASLLMDKECFFSAQAHEPTTLVTISYSELKKLYDRHVCWQKMGRLTAEMTLVEREKREYESL